MGVKPVKVSQLNSYIKRILQTDPILGNVSVTGEISNLKFHGSGHVFFSLKDENSKLSCFLPSGVLSVIDCRPEEGMEVVVSGYIQLYERGGTYSLNVRDIEEAGKGELATAFEKLKAKLEKEGLFDRDKKKPLPFFPNRVAVVTSGTGAAVRDIVKIIKAKNDCVDILIYPVLVQGPNAAGEISAAIDDLNANFDDIDVIITGRGGGSMEELMAFNEESVARSIYASDIPVISAVGHETDFTIADFVADLRAETPTAAADRAVPDTYELREYTAALLGEARRNLRMITEDRKNRLELLNPQIFGRDLQGRIAMEQLSADNIIKDMSDHIGTLMSEYGHRLSILKEILDSSNPKAVLKRGYSVVTDGSGKVVKDASSLKKGSVVHIESAKGHADAKITGTGKE